MATAAQETGIAVAKRREFTARDLPTIIRTSKTAAAQLQAFLPDGVSLERVAASVDLALRKARADWAAARKDGPCPLEKCDPASILLAVAKIQQWGLEIGETAHLVPFGTSCTPVADYKGLAELMIASGVARLVEAHCVYEKEAFRLKRGTTTEIEHHPIGDPKQRGAMIGAYCIVHVRGGIPLVEYMAVSEIDKIRQEKSKQWKGGELPEWYARKTVIRRVSKFVPKNSRLAKLLAEVDAEQIIDVPEELARTMVSAAEEAPSGTLSRTLPDHRGARPLTTAGDVDPYDSGAAVNNAPVPPAQHADHVAGDDVGAEWQDDTDLED